MAYTDFGTKTTSDANANADVNALARNIEALKGGAASAAPTTNIEALALLIGMRVDVDGVSKTFKVKVITPATVGAPADTGTGGSISIAHGVTASKVIFTIGNINVSSQRYFFTGDYTGAYQYTTYIDGANVIISGINAEYNSCQYSIAIFYYE